MHFISILKWTQGGCGFEENTGDGAGILVAIPDSFFQAEAKKIGLKLPKKDQYAVGNIFLPTLKKERDKCIKLIEKITLEEKQSPLGWREVPVDPAGANVGPASKDAQPYIAQYFIGSENNIDKEEFERKLYLIRKQFTHILRGDENLKQSKLLYACSLSSSIIVYKGMLTPSQLFPFYPDLEKKILKLTLQWFILDLAQILSLLGIEHNQIDTCVTTERLILSEEI